MNVQTRLHTIRNANVLKQVLSALFAVVPFAARAHADTLVAPNQSADSPGFGAQAPFAATQRYLSIYNPSEFLSAMPEGGEITGIGFRIDESDRTAFTLTIPDVEIRMSTSPSLSPTIPQNFSANVGPDETVVFPRNSITFTAEPAASGPNPFTIMFPLQQPFKYDPRKGSLAVDLRVYGSPSRNILIDTEGFPTAGIAGSIGSDSPVFNLGGLVLQVQFAAVPEPTVLSILLFGITAFLIQTRRIS